jgi:hypothetical protein
MPPRKRISRSTRKRLAEVAQHRCSYCRSPEWVGVPMVIDHINPLASSGSSENDNLCLSCYRCNEFKAARTRAIDPETGLEETLFHPNTQNWSEHFTWSQNGLEIIGLTACGRVTIGALRLNNEWIIQVRRLWNLVGLHPPME